MENNANDPKPERIMSRAERKALKQASILEKYELDAKDHKLLRHLIDYPSAINKELAALVDLSIPTVSARRNKPAFKKALHELQATTEELLLRAQRSAARRLNKLVNDEDKRIALEASKIALSPVLNKSQVDVNVRSVVFKTRISSDGIIQRFEVPVDEGEKEALPLSDGTSNADS